jgi:hypothetical protein
MSGGRPTAGTAENISALQKKISGMLYLRYSNNLAPLGFGRLDVVENMNNYITFTEKFGFESGIKPKKPNPTYSTDDEIRNAILNYVVDELNNPSTIDGIITDEVKTRKMLNEIIHNCTTCKREINNPSPEYDVNYEKQAIQRNINKLRNFYFLACMPPNSFTIDREDIKQALANIRVLSYIRDGGSELNDNEPIIIYTSLNEYIDQLNESLKGVLEMNGKLTDPLDNEDKNKIKRASNHAYNAMKKAITKSTLSKIGNVFGSIGSSIFGSKKAAGKRKLSTKKRKANKRKFKARKSRKH